MPLPSGVSLVMNASVEPARNGCLALADTGSEESVSPTMYALPEESTAIALALSEPMPPKKVE